MSDPSMDALADGVLRLNVGTSATTKARRFDQKSSDLIESLFKLSAKNPKLVKSSPHILEWQSADGKKQSATIHSWKMNEFKYNEVPCPFPTLARGLFTSTERDQQSKKSSTNHCIVARGYDKFFNMNEVPWNTWDAIEDHTTPPYHLTVKSNGCIIFMSALTPERVLVCSKHSIGALPGIEVSHAQMGEIWLDRHLASKGKSKVDFAKCLWDENITAIAELCDDSFEEHVLPYSEEQTGLHLHGINRNKGTFETFPPADVTSFAEEWGFIVTSTIDLKTCAEVRSFTDKVGITGEWNGYAVEGFVVRTTTKEGPRSKGGVSRNTPPYPPGSDYFFKIKFDEPYMTYRDWREMTRMVMSSLSKKKDIVIPKSKLRRPESFAYKTWVTGMIQEHPEWFEDFQHGKGIIAVRNRFLEWLQTKDGEECLKNNGGINERAASRRTDDEPWERVVIMPVAVLGCGKTLVGLALVELFGFGHTQSDDIEAKKSAPHFKRNVTELFKKKTKVVYADKNNHLHQHRQDIREAIAKVPKGGAPIKIIALNWGFHLPLAAIHRICADRITGRGENHQSLRFDQDKGHEDVIWQFLESSEELAPEEADFIVEMDVEESPEMAVTRVTKALVPLLSLEMPSEEAIQAACTKAREYAPTVRRPSKAGKVRARYFGMVVEVDLSELITSVIEDEAVPPMIRSIWETLVSERRVARRPHMTIVHVNSLPDARPLWDQCQALQALPKASIFKLRLAEMYTDGKVLGLAVEELEATDKKGQEFLDELPEGVKRGLHVTVGTVGPDISPYRAKEVLIRLRDGDDDGIEYMPLKAGVVQAVLKGLS